MVTVGVVSSPEVDGICVSGRMPRRNGAIEIKHRVLARRVLALALALTHTLAVILILVVVLYFTQVGERMRRGERLDRCHPPGWGFLSPN